jgi:hypothetical protein
MFLKCMNVNVIAFDRFFFFFKIFRTPAAKPKAVKAKETY